MHFYTVLAPFPRFGKAQATRFCRYLRVLRSLFMFWEQSGSKILSLFTCLALTFPRFGKAQAIESMHFYTVLGATEIISVAPGLLGARLAPQLRQQNPCIFIQFQPFFQRFGRAQVIESMHFYTVLALFQYLVKLRQQDFVAIYVACAHFSCFGSSLEARFCRYLRSLRSLFQDLVKLRQQNPCICCVIPSCLLLRCFLCTGAVVEHTFAFQPTFVFVNPHGLHVFFLSPSRAVCTFFLNTQPAA